MALGIKTKVKEVLKQYNDNIAWAGSIKKAKLALRAIQWLLMHLPPRKGEDPRHLKDLMSEKAAIKKFLLKNLKKRSGRNFPRGKLLK